MGARQQQPAYQGLLETANEMMQQDLFRDLAAVQAGITFAGFGIYSQQEGTDQRPSTGAIRIGGLEFQAELN